VRTLFDRHRVLLGIISSDTKGVTAFDRLCDKLAPAVEEALEADRLTPRFGLPILPEGVKAPTTTEIVIALALAWIDALSVHQRRRGEGAFSVLDDDLLPAASDLEAVFGIGRGIGLDTEALRRVFRSMKPSRGRSLPIEALRVLQAIGFFAESASDVPDDLFDALEDDDCAYVWSGDEAYVLRRQEGARCHVEHLTREDVIIESGRDDVAAVRVLHPGWTRERIGSFFLFGVRPEKYAQLALDGFREFLSQNGLGGLEPTPIEHLECLA